jgi:hypothetical protein
MERLNNYNCSGARKSQLLHSLLHRDRSHGPRTRHRSLLVRRLISRKPIYSRDLQPTYILPQVDTVGALIAPVFGNDQTDLYYIASGNLIHASRSGSWLNASIIVPNIASVFPAPAAAPTSQKKSSSKLSSSDNIFLATSIPIGVLTIIISLVAIVHKYWEKKSGRRSLVERVMNWSVVAGHNLGHN